MTVGLFHGARALVLSTTHLCMEELVVFFKWLFYNIFNAVLCTRLYMSVFASQYPGSLCGRWMRNRILNCCGLMGRKECTPTLFVA